MADGYTSRLDEARDRYSMPWYETADYDYAKERAEFDRMIEAVRAEEREKCAALIQPALTIDYITDRNGDLMQDPTMSANQALHRAAARIREKG